MKNYTITVNGNVYEVTVEEGFTGAAPAPKAAPAAPKAAPKAAAAAPKAAPAPAANAGAEGAVKITCPMPGKIIAVKTAVGTAVKKGEVVIVLEAMKMENDIVAPQDGTIASISVAAGQSVEAGTVLVTMN